MTRIPSTRLTIPLLLVGCFTRVALGDTLIGTHGPFSWTDGCGEEIRITLRVYSNVAAFPGLYKWDYQVDNISVNSNSGDAAINGLREVQINVFDGPYTPDLQNVVVPSNWDNYADGSNGFYLRVFSMFGSDPNPPGRIEPGNLRVATGAIDALLVHDTSTADPDPGRVHDGQ
jgi:hypothetical protein